MSGRRYTAGLMLIVLALGVVGCRGVQRPAVEVMDGAVTERTEEGARMEWVVRLGNPNDVPLPVTRVRYHVQVQGAGTFAVHEQPTMTLPPGEQQTVTLAAAFRNGDDDWAGRRYEIYGTFSYMPPGRLRELLAQYRVPPPVVPFRDEGELRDLGRREAQRGLGGRADGFGEVSPRGRVADEREAEKVAEAE